MNRVIINNLLDDDVKEIDVVREVLLYAMDKEKLENTTFDLILVNEEYIHELNKNYRGVDRETDVITFALEDDHQVINGSDERILGDIYISIPQARRQAVEYGHSFLREISFLAVHGFYHLLGYDHMTKKEEVVMFQKQEEVLMEYGISR